MKLKQSIRFIKRLALTVPFLATLCGCDSMIYNYEGDCDPEYKARFIFRYNMLDADAFQTQVTSVTLYLIDPSTGNIVWQRSESGDALKADGYTMDLDIAPGRYEFIAWCGEGAATDFAIPADATHHTHLTSVLNREHDYEGNAFVKNDIGRLYHGHLDAQDFPDDEGTYIYTIPLIKDTNDVNIVLQHLSGETIDKDDFTFTINDANGSMNWDNSLMDDEPITYFAHHKSSGATDMYPSENRAITTVSACVAEHTVSRLVKGNDMRLRIHNKNSECIVDIPLIDYALMVKGNHNRNMTDQEYLDRQDKYDLVFFLDEHDRWMNAFIYINSWKVVLQSTDL